MSQTVHIKLTLAGPGVGPFDIFDQSGNPIDTNVSRESLVSVSGVSYVLDDSVTAIKLVSTGSCVYEKTVNVSAINVNDYYSLTSDELHTGCVWKHLTNPVTYNTFYGVTEPYVIEYPFATDYYDQIVHNIKDFTRVYKYFNNPDGSFTPSNHIELDDVWFNKAIIYNGQQCSGLLELVPKPLHNLQSYMSYPIYNTNSKTITYTKSDSFYQYNTFWDVMKNKTAVMFLPSCEHLSIDKVLNDSNMDYGLRSFNKSPIRGKDTKVRHILDNRNDVHLVSRFIYMPTQISYK